MSLATSRRNETNPIFLRGAPLRKHTAMSPGMSRPLLGGAPRRLASSRAVAVTVAAICVLAATALVAVLGQVGPVKLLQRGSVLRLTPVKGMVPMETLGQEGSDPVYYVPMARQANKVKLAHQERPVMYYYLPENARAPNPPLMLADNATNATSTGGAAGGAKFVCTLDNIKALSTKVQAEWDKCTAADDYVVPNKDAKRRLLGWVWDPEGNEPKTAVPSHYPRYYKMQLKEQDRQHARMMHLRMQEASSMLAENATDANATNATGGKTKLAECEAKALGDACTNIAGCADPVCQSYYNDPAVEALCGMCVMEKSGCFAHAAEVYVKGKGAIQVSQLEVGDRVLAASTEGTPVSSEVIFVHDHKAPSSTVRVRVAGDVMELTPAHMVATFTAACGRGYCADAKLVPARLIRAGDRVYVSDGVTTGVQTVQGVEQAASKVRYVVTFHDNIVVNGVVAPVYSTAAHGLETLPFHLLHKAAPGVLQWTPIAQALEIILESPVLRSFEAMVNTALSFQGLKVGVPLARVSAGPYMSV